MQHMSTQLSLATLCHRVMTEGMESFPRGQGTMELINASAVFDPADPFTRLEGRNYKPSYFAKEMVWKFGADPYDESIKQHAKMWASVQNANGSFNSNYGQYWFGRQQGLAHVVNPLQKDRSSRRAAIPMLTQAHLNDNDVVCTECVTFFIREDCLHMIVHMRSSDIIFGLGTDIPTFATLYRMVFAMLGDVERGYIYYSAASCHIYERHYEMAGMMAMGLVDQTLTKDFEMPWMNKAEAAHLMVCQGIVNPSWGAYSQWLTDLAK